MSVRETAEQVILKWYEQYGNDREWLKPLIEEAIYKERERCAKAVESFDVMEWIDNGGNFRSLIATAIRSDEVKK